MVDNVPVTPGSGKTIATDEVADGTLGTVQVQFVKLMDGTLDGTGKGVIGSALSTTGLAVNARLHDGTNAGVFKNTAASTSDMALVVQQSPIGEVADASTDAGTGNKIAAKAIAGLSTATLLTAAQRGDAQCDLDRALLMRPNCALEDLQTGQTPVTITNSTSSTAILASAGSGLKWYLTSIAVANTSATAITVNILDGASVRWTMPVPVGGAIQNFATPLGGFTANTAVNAICSAGVTSIIVSTNGFKSKI
jgi:hypothetical protein